MALYSKDGMQCVRVASFFRLMFLIIVTTALQSCKKSNDAPLWDVDLLLPIAKTTVTIEDLLSDTLYTVGPDNGITIAFTQELFALDLDTVLEIPDTTFAYRYGLPLPGPVNFPGGFSLLSLTDENELDIDPIKLSEVIIRSGELEVEAISMINETTLADLGIPSATFMGSPLQISLSVPPGSPSSPSVVSEMRNPAGYVFDLRGPLFNDANTITNTVELSLAAGPGTSVTDQDSLIALIKYKDIVPEYARGYFGMESVSVDESADIDAFSSISSGILDLDQVKLIMKISNGIGVDVQAYINELNSVNTTTSGTVGLNHNIMTGPVNISRATDMGGWFIPSYQEIELNNANSNVDLFVENQPDLLDYEMMVEINPLGNISSGNDFLYFDSELRIDLETDIPLCIIASALTLQSRIDVDLPGTQGSHGLQQGKLNLFVTNGFPLGAEIKLEVYDNGTTYASIPIVGDVPSASLDVNGDVNGTSQVQLVADLSVEDVNLLYAVKSVRLTYVFDTPLPGQHIKIKDSHFMDIQLTADFNYVVNGDG